MVDKYEKIVKDAINAYNTALGDVLNKQLIRKLNKQFANIDKNFDYLSRRFDDVESRLDIIENRLDIVSKDTSKIEGKVDTLKKHTILIPDILNISIDADRDIANLKSRVSNLEK